MTIAELTAAREVLLGMMGNNILESGHGDKRIKFGSFEELKKRIDYLTLKINGVKNAKPRGGKIRFGGL